MRPLIFNTNQHKYLFTVFLFFCFFVFLLPAQAEENINVNLRIETPSQTILNQQVSVPYSCEVTDSTGATSTYAGYKAICALQSAQEQGLLNYNANNFGWGLFIEKINNIGNDANMFWSLYQNNSASMVGATDLGLSADDKIILSYVDWNYSNEILQVALSTSTIYTNSSTTLQAQVWGGAEFTNFDAPVSFFIDGTAYNAPSGTLEYIPNAEGQKKIYVEAIGKTRSEKQTIDVVQPPTPEPTQTTVNLNLRYQNSLIFSNQVVLPTSTLITDSAGGEHFTTSSSVLAALIAADATSTDFAVTDLQYYENYQSFYLNCLEITTPTTTALCSNWNYVVDGNYPAVGMDKYPLNGNENIYIYFNNPWQITASTSTFPLGTTTTFYTWRYNYDNLDAEWVADANDLIDISISTIASNEQGYADYKFSATGTYYAKITSPDWSKWSNPVTLIVYDAPTSTATSTDENTNNNGGNNTPENNNQTISQSEINGAAEKILNYLKSQQSADGKIIDGTITDWAIMSFGANGQYADEIKKENGQSLLDYEKNYNLDDPSDMNACASYPRHILAFLASGVSKNDNAVIGLKNKIKTACYKDNLYGQNGINDDVFALLALMAIDENAAEPIISDIIAIIKNDQTADGAFTWAGWPGADITGAVINALKYAETKGVSVEQNIYSKAKQYLKTQQLADGGWGYGASDVLTTSWVLMGISALGQGQNDWFNASGKNPWHPLINQLKTDGYYESSWAPGTVDWFAVKHAVPALLGKSWPIIMPVKIEKFETGNNITYTNYGGGSPTIESDVQTPTTTLFASSTPELSATSTLVQQTTPAIEQTATANEITTAPLTTSLDYSITESPPTTIIQPQNLNTTTIPKTNATPTVYYQTISSAPTSTQPINTAKTVFSISLTAASGLGLYLAWRLLQTLV